MGDSFAGTKMIRRNDMEIAPSAVRSDAAAYVLRQLSAESEFAEFAAARRRGYRQLEIATNDGPLDAVRRFATTLGVFAGGAIVGGISMWRLSQGFCSVGYLLGGAGIERFPADRVIEIGALFVVPEHRGVGLSRSLLEAARAQLADMAPALVVSFAREAEAERYVRDWGFRAVGPAAAHPFSPAVRVVPLAASLRAVLRGAAREATRPRLVQPISVESMSGGNE